MRMLLSLPEKTLLDWSLLSLVCSAQASRKETKKSRTADSATKNFWHSTNHSLLFGNSIQQQHMLTHSTFQHNLYPCTLCHINRWQTCITKLRWDTLCQLGRLQHALELLKNTLDTHVTLISYLFWFSSSLSSSQSSSSLS